MTLTNSQKTGLISTVFFHTVVLLLLLFFGFIVPYPPPQEEGFLVDFGNSETGLGLEEPSATEGTPEEVVASKKITPVAKPVSRPQNTPKVTDQAEEDLLTQEYEKTVAIAARAKKKVLDQKKAELLAEQKLKAKEEQEQREQALENQRQEAAERKAEQEKVKKIGMINSRAKNAFGGGKTDNGSQSTGQGNTYGKGNQGSPDGTPGANQYGLGGGSGSGAGGKGISYNLSGRNARSLPKPTFPGNEAGVVVVEVTVDKYGKVTKALPGIKGSNTVDTDLLEAAKKAALEASFNTDTNAPAFQKGTITYHFILQ